MKNLTFELTERVKQIIEYYGLNPYSMSVKISVSEGTIRKFLAGQIGMKVETLTKILTIFDEVSSDWLILGKGEMLRQKTTNGGHLPANSLPTPYQVPTDSMQAPCRHPAGIMQASCRHHAGTMQAPQPSALPDTTLADENKMLRDNNAALLKHIGLLEDELSRIKLQLATEREKTNSSSEPTPMEPISA